MAKILVLKPVLVSRLNGGEIALLERLRLIQSWGHEISIRLALDRRHEQAFRQFLSEVKTPLQNDAYELMGMTMKIGWGDKLDPHDQNSRSAYEEIFRTWISEERPQLIITHYTDFFASTAALQWDPERTWVDQTDDEYPRLQQLQSFPRIAEIYAQIKNFLVASPFMERSVKKAFPLARAHYLPNLLSEWRDQTKPSFEFRQQAPWLHVNPTAVKGISFVLELAEKMPSEKFLLVGNWGSTFPDRLPQNVSTQSRQENLKEILKRVKGVLMPSVWQEAFGRVPLEAMGMGVPVISSDRGALPETVGQGGLVLPLEFDLWQRAMQHSESFWKHQVDAGWKRFCNYRSEVDRVYAALKDRLSVLK